MFTTLDDNLGAALNDVLGDVDDYAPRGSYYWAGTVQDVAGSWARALEDFKSKLGQNGLQYRIEENQASGSLALNVTTPLDFGDANDLRALIDGIANEAGFRFRASMIRAGDRPLETPPPSPWTNPIGNAGQFWGSEITGGADSLAKGLGLESGSNLLLIGGLALLAFFLLGKR
jgi:hypothetical protein